MVVSFVEKTIQDAERIVKLVDLQHMFQTLDVRALSSKRACQTGVEWLLGLPYSFADPYIIERSWEWQRLLQQTNSFE
uniref:Uncharacterized protein n=1 Tax=Tanacetum cinerariifolium TaxID=118510 RepID=A0A699S6U9_TANCI|nr:hypothetical protein [Tanacetum cinerariifolium]